MSAVKRPKQTRREKAAANRERMILAAKEAFAEQGYAGTRMADIAERAGVAVQTLYFVFHTKPELLEACYEYSVLGPEKLPPPLQAFWQEMRRARSGRGVLAAFARGNVSITARTAVVDEAAKAARHEPDVLRVRTNSEALRRVGYREVITLLADKGWLRHGLDVDAATDEMLVLGSPSTYLELQGYGWSDDRIAGWLGDLLAARLL
ncbi:TetR/AcrR family transcriptional regulator [Nocardioides maradonensis]